MKKLLAGLVFTVFIAGIDTAAAEESAYTSLDLDSCPVLERHEESGSISWMCEGWRGMPLYVAAGDLRFFLSYGEDWENKMSRRQTLPPFNDVHNVLEWRLEEVNGRLRPFATILRYYTDSGSGEEQRKGEVLVVTRVADEQACHVAYVDAKANSNANALAQQAADTMARAFDCQKHQAVIVGKSGVSPM